MVCGSGDERRDGSRFAYFNRVAINGCHRHRRVLFFADECLFS
jgi:hypothetical protein